MARRRTQTGRKVPTRDPRIPATVIPRPPAGGLRGPDAPRDRPMPFDGSQVPPGFCVFVTYNAALFALLGDAPPRPTGGYGGWGLVERPDNVAITEWQGVEPLQMEIPILLDAYKLGIALDPWITAIEAMARLPEHLMSAGVEPPTVKVYGPGIPHTRLNWVIEDLAWGDQTEFNEFGQRVRQSFTVTLRQLIDADRLIQTRRTPKKKVDCKKAKSRVKKYKVRKGDTLKKIAAKYLGSANCWKRIADLNKIRDPKKIKVGQTLKLP